MTLVTWSPPGIAIDRSSESLPLLLCSVYTTGFFCNARVRTVGRGTSRTSCQSGMFFTLRCATVSRWSAALPLRRVMRPRLKLSQLRADVDCYSERAPFSTRLHDHDRCHHHTMHKADYAAIAQAVYASAQSPDDQLAGPVREALQVIDEAFDTWGYAHLSSRG